MKRAGPTAEPSVGAGWLAAVIPAGCRSVRVEDPELARALAVAGAERVESEPDVEIARSVRDLRGDASLAIVVVDPPPRPSRHRALRYARRLGASVRARLAARRIRREIARRGYPSAAVLLWDLRQRVALPGVPTERLQLAERFPGRVLARGWRITPGPTLLDDALAEAARGVAAPLELRWVSFRSGTLLAATDGGMLRVAVGPGRVQIQRQAAALEALATSELSETVEGCIPRLLARGRAGLADWSLERLLPGTRPPEPLPAPLVSECVELLAHLHLTPGGEAGGVSPVDLVQTVTSACTDEGAGRLHALAERLDGDLAGIPRGFGHGDFFAGNLLVADGHLTGIVDWDAGGPGRLPAIDLFHLQLTRAGYGTDDDWGRAVLGRLLPAARAGGDSEIRRYCRLVGLDAEPRLLQALVLSYWLGYVSYQLETHPARRSQPVWLERNLEYVLREVEPQPGRR